MGAPNFYPWDRLPRVARADAALQSAIARWLGARPRGAALQQLFGGPVRARVVGRGAIPDGAACELRVGGESIEVVGGAAAVRALGKRLLGGPDELAAPRPLGVVEHALWALAVAAAVEDLGVAGEVWPVIGPRASGRGPRPEQIVIELAVDFAGVASTVAIVAPRSIAVRAAPPRDAPGWMLDATIVVARCALAGGASFGVRDLVTVERCFELEIFGGAFALRENGVAAEVATGYVARPMALAEDAHVEVAVTLGSVRLPLRRVLDLAVGEIVELGRPLGGPFEVRAAGRMVGRGELVDVDGELAVRIVSLEE